MIIWKSKVETEDVAQFPQHGRRSWRWIFELDRWSLGFWHQVLFPKEGEWRHANRYYAINITKHFRFGSEHIYYDGPHCSFSLGFLHLIWAPEWCTKCMPEDDVEQRTRKTDLDDAERRCPDLVDIVMNTVHKDYLGKMFEAVKKLREENGDKNESRPTLHELDVVLENTTQRKAKFLINEIAEGKANFVLMERSLS